MKITKRQLRRIIREEIQRLAEDSYDQQWQDEMSGFHGKEPSANILPTDEEAMKSFVEAKIDPHTNIYSDSWDDALEKFEVKFDLKWPDGIFKIYDIAEDLKWARLTRALRAAYPEDFEERDRKTWDDQ